MKRLAWLLGLVLAVSLSAHERTSNPFNLEPKVISFPAGSPTVTLNWVVSTTTGVNYNVKRCTGTGCSNFTTIGVVGIPTGGSAAPSTYTDGTVAAGITYLYQVTAVCLATAPYNSTCATGVVGESTPSNTVTAVIPNQPPNPPGTLSITSIARNQTGINATITASWKGTPGVPTRYVLQTPLQVLKVSSVTTPTGAYTLVWSGKVSKSVPITLMVCDTNGLCDSETR